MLSNLNHYNKLCSVHCVDNKDIVWLWVTEPMNLACHHWETVQHKKISRPAKLWRQILEGHDLTEDSATLVYFYDMNINFI